MFKRSREAASLTSNSVGGSKINNVREIDEEIMEADIYLFTRALEDVPNPLTQSEAYHHWALVFYFRKDDSYKTLQGFVDCNNKLYPDYSKQMPREAGEYREVGEIKISPKQLLEYAKRNPSNGKAYVVNKENCQEWVFNLAKLLEQEDIVEKLKNFETLEKKTFVGPCVKCTLAVKTTTQNASKRIRRSLRGNPSP